MGLDNRSSSPFIHKFKTGKSKYIYDVNTNLVVRVSDIIYDIICDSLLSKSEVIAKYREKYSTEEIEEAYESINIARKEEGLFSPSRPKRLKYPRDEIAIRQMLDSEMSTLVLDVTEQCNLRCRYCVFSGQYYYRRKHTSKFMSIDLARKAIDFFLSHSMLSKRLIISFYGGEPLLNKLVIKACVDYVNSICKERDIVFHVTTNGTLIDEETARFLIEHDFLVRVSLDGPKDIHNRNRVFRNGRGTYDRIVTNLKRLQDMCPDFYDANISFNMAITPPYRLLDYHHFICESELIADWHLVSNVWISRIDTKYFDQFEPEDLELKGYNELMEMYRQAAVKNLLNLSSSLGKDLKFVRECFDQRMMRIHRRKPLIRIPDEYHPGGICIPGHLRLFVTVDGKLFPCEKCNHISDLLCIGTLDKGINYKRIMDIIDEYISLCPEDCLNCWACHFCSICFVTVEKGWRFDIERKREMCIEMRNAVHKDLVLYYSITEENPRAFDFINRRAV